MAAEEHPLRLQFELRDDASPAPRVSKGGWVKIGAVATGERFWCSVLTLSADGMLTASVDNHSALEHDSHVLCNSGMSWFSTSVMSWRVHPSPSGMNLNNS